MFLASDGIHGLESCGDLDGTELGTYMLADIGPGKQWYGGSNVLEGVVLNGVFYFAAITRSPEVNCGAPMARAKGLSSLSTSCLDTTDPSPEGLTVAGNRLYFRTSR